MSQQDERRQTPNRLKDESSLYLQQHAYNPVDWYPWGEEALARARAEDKPIIVSIGYSSCHWCHVMEKESFEDPEVAAIQNEHFVSIKVDREERPDVDRVYMAACQLLNHSGGWPLNAFLLPDGRPFFAGTYFPPQDRYGRPSWRSLLQRIHRIYTERRDELEHDAGQLTDMIAAGEGKGKDGDIPGQDELVQALASLHKKIDPDHGGFGGAPKFPNVMGLELLGLDAVRRDNAESLRLYRLTLDQMADGGMYDHLGGGFHRYSVDARWAVPHFEKMLYDNGLLLRLYAEGYRLTEAPRYQEVMDEIASYLAREMTAPEGAFYASQDADSEGEEGKFFVWTPAQIEDVLGDQLAAIICRWYGVTEEGNFEESGATVLARHTPLMAIASQFDLSVDEAKARIEEGKQKLWEAREGRIKPARDGKRITAWNALVIQGLARAALQLDRDDIRKQATTAARFYLQSIEEHGSLYRIYAQHPEADEPDWSVPGFLDDHAFLALALIDLCSATGEYDFLLGARRLVDAMLEGFYDEALGIFQFSSADAEALIVKTRSAVDEAIPASTAAAMLACQRLALATADHTYADKAHGILKAYHKEMIRYPTGFSSLVQGLDAFHHGQKAVVAALPSPLDAAKRAALRASIAKLTAPCDQIYLHHQDDQVPEAFAHLFADKPCRDGVITYYVCNDQSCAAPTSDLKEITAAMKLLEGS